MYDNERYSWKGKYHLPYIHSLMQNTTGAICNRQREVGEGVLVYGIIVKDLIGLKAYFAVLWIVKSANPIILLALMILLILWWWALSTFASPLWGDKVSMLTHILYPHKPLKKIEVTICKITRLTAHFMCGLMSDLLICKFIKCMAIHDTECPYRDQVSLNNTNQTNFCFKLLLVL